MQQGNNNLDQTKKQITDLFFKNGYISKKFINTSQTQKSTQVYSLDKLRSKDEKKEFLKQLKEIEEKSNKNIEDSIQLKQSVNSLIFYHEKSDNIDKTRILLNKVKTKGNIYFKNYPLGQIQTFVNTFVGGMEQNEIEEQAITREVLKSSSKWLNLSGCFEDEKHFTKFVYGVIDDMGEYLKVNIQTTFCLFLIFPDNFLLGNNYRKNTIKLQEKIEKRVSEIEVPIIKEYIALKKETQLLNIKQKDIVESKNALYGIIKPYGKTEQQSKQIKEICAKDNFEIEKKWDQNKFKMQKIKELEEFQEEAKNLGLSQDLEELNINKLLLAYDEFTGQEFYQLQQDQNQNKQSFGENIKKRFLLNQVLGIYLDQFTSFNSIFNVKSQEFEVSTNDDIQSLAKKK